MERFKINISENELLDLQVRLQQTRWTDESQNIGWHMGTNPAYLRELVQYWQTSYDWRKQETLLNTYPQFKTTIDGVAIHFVYVKGKGSNPKPLLLTHGWPDSFYRFYKAIPFLTEHKKNADGSDQTFDLIIPSIPGFGFSDPIALPTDRTAVLWHKLMSDVLGYKKFLAAAGDIGTSITKSLANQFPDSVTAIHLTDVGYPTGKETTAELSPPEQKFTQYFNSGGTARALII